MALLNAGCVMWSISAARVKCISCTTVRKYFNSLISNIGLVPLTGFPARQTAQTVRASTSRRCHSGEMAPQPPMPDAEASMRAA
jgi:hypothetical protein